MRAVLRQPEGLDATTKHLEREWAVPPPPSSAHRYISVAHSPVAHTALQAMRLLLRQEAWLLNAETAKVRARRRSPSLSVLAGKPLLTMKEPRGIILLLCTP